MSIIRENQIRQIKEEDNMAKKVVFDRLKRGVQTYTENIKPPQIVDNKLVDDNKGKVDSLLEYLNAVFIRLKLMNNPGEFASVFSNTKNNEFRKFIELINIVKPFNLWDDLIKIYTNPVTNELTREKIKIYVQKLSPYLRNVNNLLFDQVEALANIRITVKNLIKDAAYNIEYENPYNINLIEDLYDDIYNDTYDDRNPEDVKEVKALLEVDTAILEQIIELYALLSLINEQIKTNNLKPINKQEVAYEIMRVINEIDTIFNEPDLRQYIINLFEGTELPELAPYFKNGFGDFAKRYDELDAMNGIIDENGNVDDGDGDDDDGDFGDYGHGDDDDGDFGDYGHGDDDDEDYGHGDDDDGDFGHGDDDLPGLDDNVVGGPDGDLPGSDAEVTDAELTKLERIIKTGLEDGRQEYYDNGERILEDVLKTDGKDLDEQGKSLAMQQFDRALFSNFGKFHDSDEKIKETATSIVKLVPKYLKSEKNEKQIDDEMRLLALYSSGLTDKEYNTMRRIYNRSILFNRPGLRRIALKMLKDELIAQRRRAVRESDSEGELDLLTKYSVGLSKQEATLLKSQYDGRAFRSDKEEEKFLKDTRNKILENRPGTEGFIRRIRTREDAASRESGETTGKGKPRKTVKPKKPKKMTLKFDKVKQPIMGYDDDANEPFYR